MSARHAKQHPTVQELKQSIRVLAELPRNQGWLDLSRKLELLHRRHRDEFQDLIHEGALTRRTAYYLRDVGQLIRTVKLSTSQAESIGWTKLQIIGDKLRSRNAARLLKLAEENNVQELKRLISKKRAKPKPHCVKLYFSTDQYRRFRRAVLRHGGSSAGRGIVAKEEAIMGIIRRAEA